MSNSNLVHFGALRGVLCSSCGVFSTAAFLSAGIGCAYAQGAEKEISEQSGLVGMLASHEGILWISFYIVLTVFVLLLGWEIWVQIQIKQNGGVLPELEPETPAAGNSTSENHVSEPVAFDTSEDPFKALLNKASGDSEDNSFSSKPNPTFEAPAAAAPPKEPFRNNADANQDTDHVKRRPVSQPIAFDGSTTVPVGGSRMFPSSEHHAVSSASAPQVSAPKAAPAAQGVGFMPPKPPVRPPEPARAVSIGNVPRPAASGSLGFGSQPQRSGVPVAPSLVPPKNNVGAPVPPRSPLTPPGIGGQRAAGAVPLNGGRPIAPPAGVTPPRHAGLNNAPASGGVQLNTGVPARPAGAPARPGAASAPMRPAAPRPASPSAASNSEDSWRALAGGMKAPMPPKPPMPPGMPGGQKGTPLDIKRGPKTLSLE